LAYYWHKIKKLGLMGMIMNHSLWLI